MPNAKKLKQAMERWKTVWSVYGKRKGYAEGGSIYLPSRNIKITQRTKNLLANRSKKSFQMLMSSCK